MHTAPGFLHVFRPPPVIFVAGAINGENGRDDPKWFCQARCTAMLTQYTRSTRRVLTEYPQSTPYSPCGSAKTGCILRCVTNSNATCRTALQRRPLLPRVALPRGRAALHDYAAWHVACRMPRVVSVALRRSSVVLGWMDAARHIACRVLCAGRAGGRQAVHIDGGGAPHYPHSLASHGSQ